MKESEKCPRIVVGTTIYNMADTLYRVYTSIKKQSYENFYWLIIDNGSTDDISSVVDKIMLENKLEIKYVRKEHDNRATAINLTFDLAEGDLLVLIDADDELTYNALEIFADAWRNLGEEQCDNYARISALCIDFDSGHILGKKFPPNANTERMQKRLGFLCKEERHDAINLHIVGTKRIPILEPGLLYIGESTLWYQLLTNKKNYFVNKPTRIYHQENQNNESHKFSRDKMYSALLATIFSVNYNYGEGKKSMPLVRLLYLGCLISFYGYLSKMPIHLVVNKIQPLIYKIMILLLLPVGYYKGYLNQRRMRL